MKKIIYFITIFVLFVTMICPIGSFAETSDIIFINEVMASNKSTLRDGDLTDKDEGSQGGAFSDWIEVYNSGTQAIDISGYSISDDEATWIIPKGTVPANGHLLIWASDKDMVGADGQLHTNFKITSEGETITLNAPNGSVIDSITTTKMLDDESYGRKSDGSSEFVVFLDASPRSTNIFDPNSTKVTEPIFSIQGGFYTQAFNLELGTSESGVRIYYTTDGSDPIPGVAGTNEYISSLNIASRAGEPNDLSMIQDISTDRSNQWKAPVGEVFKCSTIKAVAVRADGKQSKIITHSYFVDSDMKSRYSLPIVSIVTDRANFFDATTGIYVGANAEKGGSEWERPVHIEFFETDGTLGFSQYAGARIHGGYTRKFPQKSIRLYADKDYDVKGKFEYEVFPDLRKNGNGKKLKEFDRLLLRNSGNDWTEVMFRDAMMHSLVKHLDLETMAYRPSVVFLNGEYWGIYNIRERYDEEYLSEHYSLEKDNIAILDYYEKLSVQQGTEEDALAYTNDILKYLETNSITQKSTYDYINTKMDIQNFIDYNVSQIFFGNTDWPGNNVSMWKYRTEDGQYHPEASKGQDGRWRWFLKDTDFGFSLYSNKVAHDTLAYATADRAESNMNMPEAVFLLKTLLQNTDFRNEFINRFADNLNTSFDPERVNSIIDEIVLGIEKEMPEHSDRWQVISMISAQPQTQPQTEPQTEPQTQPQTGWGQLPTGWGQPQVQLTWNDKIQVIKDFATNRPSNVRGHILNKFSSNGVSETYTITLNSNSTQGYIKINSIEINDTTPTVSNPNSWSGTYFNSVPLTLKAIAKEGYLFDHWEGVTGISQASDTITYTPSGNTNITAVFKSAGTISTPTPTPQNNDDISGDLNGDGKVNSTDYALMRRYLLGIVEIQVANIYAVADLNVDGKINSTDYVILRRYLLGIITSLPY